MFEIVKLTLASPSALTQLPILRTVADVVTDEHGASQTVTIDDLDREVQLAPAARQKRLNIPIPVGGEVPDYEAKTPGGYEPPVSYIRMLKRGTEDPDVLEYLLEHNDEVRGILDWILVEARICPDGRPYSLVWLCLKLWLAKRGHGSKLLDDSKLELMLDVLEKVGTPVCIKSRNVCPPN